MVELLKTPPMSERYASRLSTKIRYPTCVTVSIHNLPSGDMLSDLDDGAWFTQDGTLHKRLRPLAGDENDRVSCLIFVDGYGDMSVTDLLPEVEVMEVSTPDIALTF